jgi:hypothetical protein
VTDARLFFPATSRNRDPIIARLRDVLAPPITSVLEIASGSGEHAVAFARAMPWLIWQPTDVDPQHLASIDAWREHEHLANVQPARMLDVGERSFPDRVDAVFCANLIHIAPWEVALGLVACAQTVLSPGGVLVTYGPYRRGGAHTAPSNEAFDASLRSRDPRWGVRDMEALEGAAEGFVQEAVHPMPANNFLLVFRRRAAPTEAQPTE